MEFFDIEWTDFVERLTVLEQLPLEARRAFVDLKSNQGKAAAVFDGVAPDLVAAGFLSYSTDGRRVRISDECRPFSLAIRGITRHDIFGSPSEVTLLGYLRECFTARHLSTVIPNLSRSGYGYGYGYGHAAALANRARSMVWLDQLLAADNGDVWKRSDRFSDRGRVSPLDQPDVFEAVQKIVRQFKEFAGPVPVRDLAGRFAALPKALFDSAILVCIRYLYLFVAMRPDDMLPIIGLWPSITQRLHRPTLKQPAPVQPDETFQCSLLLDDMTTILVATSARPIRLRVSDETLFAKAQAEIESNCVSTPDWIGIVRNCSPSNRVDDALLLLRALGFVQTVDTRGNKPTLHVTDKGIDWLAASDKKRLLTVLDRLNPDRSGKVKKRKPAATVRYGDSNVASNGLATGAFSFELMPYPLVVQGRSDWSLLAELIGVFETLGDEHFVRFEEFAAWHSQELNPLLCEPRGESPLQVRIGWERYEPTDEQSEILWWNVLAGFFFKRLFPLGGLRVGVVGKQPDLCISLTDVGRYLLGLVDDFEFGYENEESKPVLVQPNFDVVFTSPSPQAEASIGRFAERMGRRVGTLFKITKKSVLAAACIGMTASDVLEVLRQNSAKGLPANVEREIQGWFEQCRHVSVRRAMLVHCPDPQTAARVVAAGGVKATAISDTVVELAGSKRDAALFRKLNAMGIFSD